MTPQSRHGLYALVSKEAFEGWGSFARHHGVTRAAVVEAIGQLMAAGVGTKGPPPVDILDRTIGLAREIDTQRRMRAEP